MGRKYSGLGLKRRLWKSQSHRRERLWTRLHFWVRERQVDEWAERTNVFFVLALGRSRTSVLAHLLDKAPGAEVFHEPVRSDCVAYRRAFHEPPRAKEYDNGFRKKEIYLRARGRPLESYGEVNSVLGRHAVALQEAFPNSTLFHLIRDGRDVIRSMMARKTMGPADRNIERIRPRPGDKCWNRPSCSAPRSVCEKAVDRRRNVTRARHAPLGRVVAWPERELPRHLRRRDEEERL